MADTPGKIPPFDIFVNGVSKLSHLAERCVLSAKATSSGPDQETVSTEVLTASKTLENLLRPLAHKTIDGFPHPDAPVTTLSIGSLSNSSHVNTDPGNRQPLRTYTATVWFEATFRNFAKLGEIGALLLATPHVAIHRTHWKLTDKTIDRLKIDLRKLVLENAIQKANDYAQVLGRKVVAVEVRDAETFGWQSRQVQSAQSVNAYHSYMQSQQKEERVGFEPDHVEFTMHIDVKFKSVD